MFAGLKRIVLVCSLVGAVVGCVDDSTPAPEEDPVTSEGEQGVTQPAEWSPVPCCTEAPCGDLPICEVNN